ncbi:MAG: prepilin-type N-terminal cleavage/methylation domain-containing protein [Candidatus Omnitrophota bacterium]
MKDKRAGMSLVEIIVAMVIIAIATIASFQFLVHCDKFVIMADNKVAAANFAREIMEDYYQEDYDDLAVGSHSVSIAALASRLHNGTGSYEIGSEKTESATSTKYKVITVKVGWDP